VNTRPRLRGALWQNLLPKRKFPYNDYDIVGITIALRDRYYRYNKMIIICNNDWLQLNFLLGAATGNGNPTFLVLACMTKTFFGDTAIYIFCADLRSTRMPVRSPMDLVVGLVGYLATPRFTVFLPPVHGCLAIVHLK
jgi:hypothetical protein